MSEMSKDQMDYINKIGAAEIERNNGNPDFAIKRLNELWEGIPEPKYEYKESFLVAWSMMDTAIMTNNTELMREWLPHIFKADPERYDSGERDMYAGMVEYECGNFEKFYEHFDIARKKSSSRCFRRTDGFDKKYREFYKNREAEKKKK